MKGTLFTRHLCGWLALLVLSASARFQYRTPVAAAGERGHYLTLATNAMNDLLGHFWSGDARTGQIVNTWNGYPTNLPDARGALWERAMFYFVLHDFWRVTGDRVLQQRLAADWQRTTNVYSADQLAACGQDSGVNWAADDAGWSAMMYLDAYDATGDAKALTCARGLVEHAFHRWLDDRLDGGLWYSDAKHTKSLYQVSLVLSALRVDALTGDRAFHDRALQCYAWMETHLLRPDHLYWCDYNALGPVGRETPDHIREAGSVVFLGGNMGMAVLHARLYQMTGDTNYLGRAVRTADAILRSPLATVPGVYLNDRDAWTEGAFAGEWAREVLSLRGIAPEHRTLLWTTADSIFRNARTNGYYGGSWSGPAAGPNSAWWAGGSKPEQLTTSASSANLIVAAAALARGQI